MGAGIKMEVLSGLFWKKDGAVLFCTSDDGETDVFALLSGFLDSRVKVALHHWPSVPQSGLWGGGCCLWQPSGKCPAGHHEDPSFLLNFGGEGFLRRTADQWGVELADGSLKPLPFDLMEGHRSRLVIVTAVDIEEFKKGIVLPSFSDEAGPEQVEAVREQLQNFRDLMGQFKSFLDSVKED